MKYQESYRKSKDWQASESGKLAVQAYAVRRKLRSKPASASWIKENCRGYFPAIRAASSIHISKSA
jgi:hypothetical protein